MLRISACGLPGCSKSSRVRDQQASWTMRRKAMQMRKDESLPIVATAGVDVGVLWSVGVVDWLVGDRR